MAAFISRHQVHHVRGMLEDIRTAHMAGKKKYVGYSARRYLKSFDAKRVAVESAYRRLKAHRRPSRSELNTIAKNLNPWKGTKEEVIVHWKRKTSNPDDFRVTMDFGLENRALQYHTLSLLQELADLHPRQYATRGGVNGAISDLAEVMKNGPVWSIELDIKDCYPSFDGKKLPSLIPLPKEVTDHVIISEHLYLKGGNLYQFFGPADGEEWGWKFLFDDALADARRGIPQGSAVSPLVAEMVLAPVLHHVPPIGDVFAYADNVLLMAASETDAVTMLQALWSALEAHPVGRLRPKAKLFRAGAPIDFLGHRLTSNNGKIYIAPDPSNQEQFERTKALYRSRLRQKDISDSERVRIFREYKRYVRSWTAAFSLCDGIAAIRAAAFQF